MSHITCKRDRHSALEPVGAETCHNGERRMKEKVLPYRVLALNGVLRRWGVVGMKMELEGRWLWGRYSFLRSVVLGPG